MKNLLTLIFIVFTLKLNAQIGINATGAAPDAKAMLDISSTTKGFLWPRMTIAQRNAISSAPGVTPEGLTVFDTDTKNLWIYKNAAWQAYLPSQWEASGNDIFNNNSGNVGIGVATPQAKLHVSGSTSTSILNEITGPGNAALELKTSAAAYDFLELRKWSTGAGGFYGSIVTPTSIPLTGLSMLTSGTFSTGGLLIGTNTANPLYFSTNLTEKMRITADGNVGIGTTLPTQKLDIGGQIRIRGGSPAAGKVLTSAADGTASWQVTALPTHNHFGVQWVGDIDSPGLRVDNYNNTSNSASGLRGSMLGGGSAQNAGVEGFTDSNWGTGVQGINFSSASWAVPTINVGVSGLAGTGTGVFGSSISGASIYGRKGSALSTGNAGLFENSATSNPDATVLISNSNNSLTALELRNGYLKVSGANKTAFIITAGSGGTTITGNRVRFSYPGMSSTDILIVNHQYVASYIGAVGNWYDTLANQWSIFREDQAAMPAGEKFTVLVIKQ